MLHCLEHPKCGLLATQEAGHQGYASKDTDFPGLLLSSGSHLITMAHLPLFRVHAHFTSFTFSIALWGRWGWCHFYSWKGTLLSNSTPCFPRRKTGTGTQVAGCSWSSPHGSPVGRKWLWLRLASCQLQRMSIKGKQDPSFIMKTVWAHGPFPSPTRGPGPKL